VPFSYAEYEDADIEQTPKFTLRSGAFVLPLPDRGTKVPEAHYVVGILRQDYIFFYPMKARFSAFFREKSTNTIAKKTAEGV
jgi:hypothetical protein